MGRSRTFFVAVLCVAALSATRGDAADTYNVYAEISLTGQAAFVGKGLATAFQGAEQIVNQSGGVHGRPVHFVIEDDQSSPQVAVQLFNDVVAKHVPVLLGPAFSAPCYAVLPLVKEQIVNYCLAPSIHPNPGSYSFSASASTKDLALAGIRYFHGRGWKKVAILDTTDATGQDGDNVIKEDLALPEFRDMELVSVEHFAPSDVTVSAQIARIRASGAQAMVTWVVGAPFATVCRNLNDAGFDLPVLTDAGNISYAQMAQYKSFLPKSLYFTGFRYMARNDSEPAPVRKMQSDFYAAMAAQGIKPDSLNATGWDSIFVVIDALRHVSENPSAKQVHDYIERMKAFPGINGYMDFTSGNQRGVDASAAMIVRYDADSVTWIPTSKPGGVPL